jgi:hypothetical protein
MQHVIHLAEIKWLADIVLLKFESRLIPEMAYISGSAGKQIVDRQDRVPFPQQGITQMGA